ncbi:4a-hydroxytetrahydrobiopterin dehydratase [Ramlibacter sp. MAHUQ-53]|uniref:4a-hydroxytetrahydrobiopterin dehydratase n=1 Tax=unclassified Ramlibacter TaxID=2617605 RepID=UPI0036451B9F
MTTSMLRKKDWSKVKRRAFTPTELVTRLITAPGWKLAGDGDQVAIEKTFTFANYHETLAFVNAVAFIAHTQDHHPDLSVHYSRCVVRFNTHDVGGISESDFDCAAMVDALVA